MSEERQGAEKSTAADWTLDPESFGRFLMLLDSDVKKAALKYEQLRRKLVTLFEWRRCRFAEDLADETINRVCRRVDQGLDLASEDVAKFSTGVAKFVFQEYLRRRRREEPPREARDRPPFVPGRHTTTDLRLSVLEQCLERLTSKERDLILRYYQKDRAQRIASRKALAEELGLAANTLRIRAYRIRAKLLDWMQESEGRETAGLEGLS